MRDLEIRAPLAVNEVPGSARLSRSLFVAAILAGSFLLFLVQPMVARMALPRLGGAPAVWNSAMLVYQALLLCGYAYAHALSRLPGRAQALVHLAVLVVAALWLPIGLSTMAAPPELAPALWVPLLLGASIGPLFFAVSAQAPLLQHWFALRSPGANPYALYAASNLGSFGGLIAYPLLVEPTMTVAGQSLLWSVGYGMLILLVAICATRLPTSASPAQAAARDLDRTAPRATARQWFRWIALAAVPSGLMLSTTTHLTTDIVAMPLIWVVPLSLYLLSFSIAFADRRGRANAIVRLFPVAIVVGAEMAFAGGNMSPILSGGVDLLLLFVVAVALHGELYRLRPAASGLTGFYLAMSVGGVLGGILCALVAPMVFDWVYEHPLLIVGAAALLPQRTLFSRLLGKRPHPIANARFRRWLPVALLALSLAAGGLLVGTVPKGLSIAIVAVLALLVLLAAGNRPLFAGAVLALMLAGGGWLTLLQSTQSGMRTRSYFGIYTISNEPNGTRLLIHGTTTHGVQRTVPGHERDATSYYAAHSGVGDAMAAVSSLFGKARVGVVGLGAGTLACYARPGQSWRFYEIDPAVAAIARDPARFSFLSRCTPGVPIVIGDARLSLADTRAAMLDLLVVDAFSSDAVPMHLLTREAFAVYGRALAPRGLLMVHISNRFFDLEPVLGAAADAGGWRVLVRDYTPDAAAAEAGAARSLWVAMSRDPQTLSRLTRVDPGGWRPAVRRAGFTAWSDDFATVLPLLKGF